MNDSKQFQEIIRKTFSDRNFLKEEKRQPKTPLEEILGGQTEELLDALFFLTKQGRVNSLKAAELAQTYIPSMKMIPESGWAKYVSSSVRHFLFPEQEEEIEEKVCFEEGRLTFLQLLRALYRYEAKIYPFDPTYQYRLPDEKSPLLADSTKEYGRFKRLAQNHYIYEFMRLNADLTSFNTVGHMCGVHYVAMMAAKQLREAGVPVDLGLISGAAAGHDIGKFGCRKSEERRVPYLHYYYTDLCYRRFELPAMAQIAGNHSTWDLELEDLSVESLLLIYADFRVKSIRKPTPDGSGSVECIKFYNLKDSYDVILGKLDNVDDAKKHRYEKVYAKLHDFEEYMRKLGVRVDLPEDWSDYDLVPQIKENVIFLSDQELIEEYKYRAIDHNIRMMAQIHEESGFTSVIEAARSELQWKNKRTYLNILNEYSTYLPERQKLLTAEYFYEELMNRESDIRSMAAVTLGRLCATFREEYKKELPEGIVRSDVVVTNVKLFETYLDKIIYPSHKHAEQHRIWIRSCLHDFVKEVLSSCRESCRHRYVEVLAKYYVRRDTSPKVLNLLLRNLGVMREEHLTDAFMREIPSFLDFAISKKEIGLQFGALLARHHLLDHDQADFYDKMIHLLSLKYKKRSVDSLLDLMYLDDLKISTSRIDKLANIACMRHYALYTATDHDEQGRLLHIATHLGNLVKVSETVDVRLAAGEALVSIAEILPVEQRNEVAVELFNGLEIGDIQFTRYIPDYLGRILLFLAPKEINEFLDDLRRLMDTGNEKTNVAVLNTLFVALEGYDAYRERFGESEEVFLKRRSYILGLLLKAFSGFDRALSQEAFWLIGNGIFGSHKLSLEQKAELFRCIGKKLITIFDEKVEKELDTYNNAASLNDIYRFISEYQTEKGEIVLHHPEKVAFFPGTFDPFSLGHKALARAIRNAGFEVYLALDEFSWSKKTQPHLERRRIMLMSTADEEHMYLFSENVPVNIANPSDLKCLKEHFKGRELYIAVGTDVIRNASCYKAKPCEDSIHSMNHITFARESKSPNDPDASEQTKDYYPITGEILELSVKKYYEDISSTRIRENINQSRDISNLVDSFAQRYIYQKNLYLREPTYKHLLQAEELLISPFATIEQPVLEEVIGRLGVRHDKEAVASYLQREDVKVISIESGTKKRKVIALAGVHCIDTDRYYEEFKDVEIASHVRERAGGRAAIIGFFKAFPVSGIANLNQILLTEVLTELLKQDYTYAVYHPIETGGQQEASFEIFRRQGFIRMMDHDKKVIYDVDMKAPNIIFRDVEAAIKSPFNKSRTVLTAIDNAHNRLLHTIASLYPGELTLSFHSNALYNKMIQKVAMLNHVSTIPDPSKVKGPYMSVPFGNALSDVVVPNTVTKTVHTEKFFRQDLDGFRIGERRGYATLENQAKMIRSFNRPIILIEDLLHKGYRMQKITKVLSENDVEVKATVAGVLTGKAKDRMKELGRRVESAYFIPSIHVWLNERDCYPFIGGDGIDNTMVETGDQHINLIMPYALPGFIAKDDFRSVYQYSMACLENAYEIMKALETEYQRIYERKLTMKRLGEVISHPRIPYLGVGIDFDEAMTPSTFLENDIRKLQRMGGLYY